MDSAFAKRTFDDTLEHLILLFSMLVVKTFQEENLIKVELIYRTSLCRGAFVENSISIIWFGRKN